LSRIVLESHNLDTNNTVRRKPLEALSEIISEGFKKISSLASRISRSL
jgi:hypothetical protein